MMKYFILILLCFLLSACITSIELHNNDSSSSFTPEKQLEETIPTFFFGFISPSKKTMVWNKCQKDMYSVKVKRPFSHIIAALFTLGIYTPLKVIIVCYKEPKSATDKTEDELEDALEDELENELEDELENELENELEDELEDELENEFRR